MEGLPFRDAYQKVAEAIEKGDFEAPTKLDHSHIGSLGNLCLAKIEEKLNQTIG